MRPMPAAPPPSPSPATMGAVSLWHSPVPYLFGGLAAMLGLITLALLILACSCYWKLNNYLGTGGDHSRAGDGGDGSKSPAAAADASPVVFRDLIAVVMAGERLPTFLATPIVRRSPSAAHAEVGSPEKTCNVAEGGEASRRPPQSMPARQAVHGVQLVQL